MYTHTLESPCFSYGEYVKTKKSETDKDNLQGGRPAENHQLTLDMAKHLAMIQRTPIGYKVRQYFIDVEKKWRDEHTPHMMQVAQKFAQGDAAAAEEYISATIGMMSQALKVIQQEREKNQQLTGENESLKSSLAAMQPKINYVDVVLNHPGLITTTIITKDYGYTTMKFNKLLHKLHIVFKQSGIWQLYAEYAALGWGKNKTTYQDNTGCVMIHNYWTQKGRLGLYELLKTQGILPLIEQEEIDAKIDADSDN